MKMKKPQRSVHTTTVQQLRLPFRAPLPNVQRRVAIYLRSRRCLATPVRSAAGSLMSETGYEHPFDEPFWFESACGEQEIEEKELKAALAEYFGD